MTVYTREELQRFSRRRLQALGKQHDIKGNIKSTAIIERLLTIYSPGDNENQSGQDNLLNPSEVTKVSPSAKSQSREKTEPLDVSKAENNQISVGMDSSDAAEKEDVCRSDNQHDLIPDLDRESAHANDDRKGEQAPADQIAQSVDGEASMALHQTQDVREAINPVGDDQIPTAVRSNSIVVQDAMNSYRKIAMESRAVINGEPLPKPEVITNEARKPEKNELKVEPTSTKAAKPKFDLKESLSRPIGWEMKKGPLPPVSAPALEDPNRLCLWSPAKTSERKREFKNNEFGGTKKRLNDYLLEGQSKTAEKIREHRRPTSPSIDGPKSA